MKIAIIGAGVAGLTAAYELATRGQDVTVFEKDTFAGGLASGFRDDRWAWPLERFYHHLFQSDNEIIHLAQRIGIGHTVIFRRPITAIWSRGAAYPFDSTLSVLRFPHLNLMDKMRTGLVILSLRLRRNWRPLEAVTAHQWLPTWMGRQAYQTLWEPLLIGKFGEYYQQVNMAWFWARMYKRSPRLGYFVGGFQAFVDALVQAIEQAGGHLRLGTAVQSIHPTANGLLLTTVAGSETFDRVIVTLPPALLSKLAPSLPPEYLGALQGLPYLGAVVMTVALDRPLTRGLYWINLRKDEFPFLAAVEHTNYMNPEHYGGDHLVYLGDYLPAQHRYFFMTKDDLEDLFLPVLRKFNPSFQSSWVRKTWLHREPYAQPVVTLHHSRRIPPLQTPIPGLYFASMAQVYPWDRGTNYAVEIGRKVANLVLEEAA